MVALASVGKAQNDKVGNGRPLGVGLGAGGGTGVRRGAGLGAGNDRGGSRGRAGRGAGAAAPPPAVDGPRTYTPEDFTRYAPRNALDMLARVPGFTIREAIQERGLGQATGNVLLNGQRISGKSDDVQTRLSRIPAGNVIRIEIRDGATLAIPGLSGQVANVVVRATGITGQYAWRPEFRRYFTDPLFTRFETSVSGRRGRSNIRWASRTSPRTAAPAASPSSAT